MASLLSTATFSCIYIEDADDAAEALGKLRGACLNICAAKLKPPDGARQSGATRQAEDLPRKIGVYGKSKEGLHRGACEPRAHVHTERRRPYASALQSQRKLRKHFSHAIEGVDCYISPVEADTQINVMNTMFTLMGRTCRV